MTERVLSQVKAAEMEFLRRAHIVALHNKMRYSEIYKVLSVEPLVLRSRDPSYVRSATCPECPKKEGEASPGYTTGTRARDRTRARWSSYDSVLAWPRLGVKPIELSKIDVECEVCRVLLGLLTP